MSSIACPGFFPTASVQWLKESVWACFAPKTPLMLFEQARDLTKAPQLQQAMAAVEEFVRKKRYFVAAPRESHALHDRVTEIALAVRAEPRLQKAWGSFVAALHHKPVAYPDGRTLILDFSAEIDLLKEKSQADIAIEYHSGDLQERQVDEIVAIEAESFSNGERWGYEGYRQLQHCPEFQMLLARDAKTKQLLGYIGFGFEYSNESPPVLNVATVARRANAAKRGVASKLLTELFHTHCPPNVPATLSVRDGNTVAKRLYEQFGFKPAYYTKNVYPFPNERQLKMVRA